MLFARSTLLWGLSPLINDLKINPQGKRLGWSGRSTKLHEFEGSKIIINNHTFSVPLKF